MTDGVRAPEPDEGHDVDDSKAEMAAKLQTVIDDLNAARERGEIPVLEVVPLLLQAMDQQARVLELYPPERVVIVDEDDKPAGPPPDPAVVEAIQDLMERRRAEKAANNS